MSVQKCYAQVISTKTKVHLTHFHERKPQADIIHYLLSYAAYKQ